MADEARRTAADTLAAIFEHRDTTARDKPDNAERPDDGDSTLRAV